MADRLGEDHYSGKTVIQTHGYTQTVILEITPFSRALLLRRAPVGFEYYCGWYQFNCRKPKTCETVFLTYTINQIQSKQAG